MAVVCLISALLFYRKVKNSILDEVGVWHMFEVDGVRLAQYDWSAEEYLDGKDKFKLFFILSNVQEYDKSRDREYLPDGHFLMSPKIMFVTRDEFDIPDHDSIFWNYKKDLMYKKDEKVYYYIKKKDAAKLKELFDKYIDLRGMDAV